jgi:hypothetical protein
MTAAVVSELDRLQDADGCFPCTVTGPGSSWPDRNGFVTALVVRALRDVEGAGRIRSRALGFVEQCRSADTPGAFGFWPQGERPSWAPRLPADVDDTAIMTLELLRYGRISRMDALRTVCRVLLPQRSFGRAGIRPPWIAPGAFHTWISEADRPNPVDACVNANVVALMAALDVRHLPGYAAAVGTVVNGVAWAGRDPVRHHAITPFYPRPYALREAVEHAVECGARALQPLLARPSRRPGPPSGPQPVCCAAYGHTYWWCPALYLWAEMRSAACSTSTPTWPGRSSTGSTARTAPVRSC